MKKIIAAAVTAAFVAPAFAADITISGDQEFSWQDSNGASTTKLDGDFNIKASTETANGLSVSADINVAEDGADDGSASLTIGGPFGKIDAGDTSSALDAIDDVTDWGYELTQGTPNEDAAILWTLPSVMEGLTLYASFSGETNYAANSSTVDTTESNGFAAKYAVGDFSVRMGVNDNKDASEQNYVGVTYSMAGIGLAAEQFTNTDDAGTDTDTDSVSLTYGMGDVTIAAEMQEISSGGTTSSDRTTLGVHYSLGGGVTAFIENTDDKEDPAEETTAMGVAFKF